MPYAEVFYLVLNFVRGLLCPLRNVAAFPTHGKCRFYSSPGHIFFEERDFINSNEPVINVSRLRPL